MAAGLLRKFGHRHVELQTQQGEVGHEPGPDLRWRVCFNQEATSTLKWHKASAGWLTRDSTSEGARAGLRIGRSKEGSNTITSSQTQAARWPAQNGPRALEPRERAVAIHSASRQKPRPECQPANNGFLDEMVGSSSEMQRVFAMIQQVAPKSVSALISGESGTGKEIVAQTIHRLSNRRDGPFVAINCAALPEALIESELFGHEKGSFTGAVERRQGCFELASGGTLLLDEIGEMPIFAQAKMLRVLQDHRVRRLGGRNEIQLDVRVLAATNKNPETAIRSGELREDLYYRLNVFHIALPPLRNHKEDLALLAEACLDAFNRKHGCRVTGIDAEVLDDLHAYSWPGNVRELRNVLERAVIIAGDGMIHPQHLACGPQRPMGGAVDARPDTGEDCSIIKVRIGSTVAEAEQQLVLKTLEHTVYNKVRAAKILGISLKTLYNKLK